MNFPFEPTKPEQNPYLQCSYSYLPHSRALHNELKSPLFFCLTPIPPNAAPVQLNNTIQTISRCNFCQAFANPYSDCRNQKSFKCNICGKQATPRDGRALNPQQQTELVYDCRFPHSDEKAKHLKPVEYRNIIFVAVLELSESTYADDVYINTLEKVYETISTRDEGYATILVYNNGLLMPSIVYDQLKMTIFVDLDDFHVPPSDFFLFNLSEQMDLFDQYVEKLKALKPQPVRHSLLEIMKVLHTICDEDLVNPIILCSECQISSPDEFRDLANRTLANYDTADIIAIEPLKSTNDFSPLFSYMCMLYGFVRVYKRSESDDIPIDFVNRLFQSHLYNCSIVINLPPCFTLVDIHGAGLRDASNHYIMPIVCTGDTVFIEVDYNTNYLPASVDIQIVARFEDTRMKRFARVINLRLNTRNTSVDVFNTMNHDILLAGIITRAVSNTRPEGFAARAEAIRNAAKTLLSVNESNIRNQVPARRGRIVQLLNIAPTALNDVNTALVFGHSVEELVGFLAPEAWIIYPDNASSEVMMLSGVTTIPRGTALLVRLNSMKAYIYVDDQATANNIMAALSDTNSIPCREVINKIGSARVVIICREINASHPLIAYTYMMMNSLK